MKRKKGFTLIELVLVIAILGILAVTALPNIYNISLTTARINARDAVVSAVQAAVSIYGVSQLSLNGVESYPALLDAAVVGAGSNTNLLFSTVLKNGISSIDWSKLSNTCYSYTATGAQATYIYTPATGSFVYGVCP